MIKKEDFLLLKKVLLHPTLLLKTLVMHGTWESAKILFIVVVGSLMFLQTAAYTYNKIKVDEIVHPIMYFGFAAFSLLAACFIFGSILFIARAGKKINIF
ncbi:MAG: hypothetical protein ABIG60_00445 [Patescibacteria group bacterium]